MARAVIKRSAKAKPKPRPKSPCDTIVRGYFSLGDSDHSVDVTSNADFLLFMVARNSGTSRSGIQILTPASQFRSSALDGPRDGLVLSVPAQTGVDLGCVGGQAGEEIHISAALGGRVGVFLTVQTAHGATVRMTGDPRR